MQYPAAEMRSGGTVSSPEMSPGDGKPKEDESVAGEKPLHGKIRHIDTSFVLSRNGCHLTIIVIGWMPSSPPAHLYLL